MAKIDLSSRANSSPAETLFPSIVLLLGIVFAVFGIKLKWFRHRLTFNSSASNHTPISNTENTNQIFGVYKRNEIDDRDFRARVPNDFPASSHNGESSTSNYKTVKVNNEMKLIPPPPSYTPPTIHQGNIRTTELRVDYNNNNNNNSNSSNNKKIPAKDVKQPKYIRVKKDEQIKKDATSSKGKPKAPQPIQNTVAQTHNNKTKAAAPILVLPPAAAIAPPLPKQPPPPVEKQEVNFGLPIITPIPQIKPTVVTTKQDTSPVFEAENPAITAKLNSMPTTYIQLNDFDSAEYDDTPEPPPTIRSVKFQDEYKSYESKFSYDDPIAIVPSTQNTKMTYNDKIEIVTNHNDDLFTKMKPTPRTTGINYLEYQSNKRNNTIDDDDNNDNSESKFVDDEDYELAPLEFLSKTTTTPTTKATSTATVKKDETKTTTIPLSSNRKDERKVVLDDSNNDDDDDDDDNMWDLVATHRKSVGRKVEWDKQSTNANGKMKFNQRAMMSSSIAGAEKPKTLRELHSQSRDINRKIAPTPTPIKATSKSNVVTFNELDDEADA